MKKNIIALFSAFVVLSIYPYVFAGEENVVNSTLIEVHDYVHSPGDDISIIAPFDQKKYPLINKNPLLFFLLVNNWNERKIENIKIENIKNGNLAGYLLPFYKIEGFTMASEIANLNKFELLDKKDDIISNLKQCYSKYKKEYEKYLTDTFIFTNCPKARNWTKLKGYTKFKDINVTNQTESSRCWATVRSNRYNIDTQMVTISLFGFWDEGNWEKMYRYAYGDSCKKRYGKRIPKKIDVLLPVDKAKELFSNSKEAYSQTLITAKPLRGWMSISFQTAYRECVGFRILNIRKIFSTKDAVVYNYELSPGMNYPF
jgi:hypothetical protein